MTAQRSYDQFCPASRTLDLLGERWTLLIIRDLLTGPKRWSDLRASLPRLGSNLLADRLKALEAAGIVARRELPPPAARTVYELTDRGRELDAVVLALARFGLPYLDLPTDEQPLLPHLQDEALRPMVRFEAMPREGATIRFELAEGRYLMTIDPLVDDEGVPAPFDRRLDVSTLTADDLAGDADAVVEGTLPTLLWIRQGHVGWTEAVAGGDLTVDGDDDLVRALFAPGHAATADASP